MLSIIVHLTTRYIKYLILAKHIPILMVSVIFPTVDKSNNIMYTRGLDFSKNQRYN
jgi:hypothetical protein